MPKKNWFGTHQEYLDYYKKYVAEHIDVIREQKKEYMRRWRLKNNKANKYPEKEAVRRKTRQAISKGELIKLPCLVCGEIKVEAHHEDYSKPFDVIWVCRKHHNQYHKGLITLSPGSSYY